MIGLSPPARYSVILIDCTRGSAAACSMNASIDVVKLSYGWWTMIARSRITDTIGRSLSMRLGDPTRHHWGPWPVLEVGPVECVELPQAAQIDQTAHPVDVVLVHVELADEQVEHLVAHRIGDLEPHGAVESAAPQLHLDGFE